MTRTPCSIPGGLPPSQVGHPHQRWAPPQKTAPPHTRTGPQLPSDNGTPAHEQGMSTRAIAPIVGTTHTQVRRDQAQLEPDVPVDSPRISHGLDGRTRTRTASTHRPHSVTAGHTTKEHTQRPATSRTGTAVWKQVRAQAIRRARREGIDHCPDCGILLDYEQSGQRNSAEADHIVPHSKGGKEAIHR